MNIKLTKNLIRTILRRNIGTNDIERYVKIVCKQNVRKKRNVDMIRNVMKMNLMMLNMMCLKRILFLTCTICYEENTCEQPDVSKHH